MVHVSFANGSHHVVDDWDVTEDLTHATVYPDVFRRYAVTLIDDDASTDHLALTPLRDPYHNRLREVWIDATTETMKGTRRHGS